jgi:hypothetical protein
MIATILRTAHREIGKGSGKWDEDAAAFEKVPTHILHMSDALSDGNIKQFPQRF